MEHFITKHADKIQGVLSCFDRILFRGYLPFFSGAALAMFLDRRGIKAKELKPFLLQQASRLKQCATELARLGLASPRRHHHPQKAARGEAGPGLQPSRPNRQ